MQLSASSAEAPARPSYSYMKIVCGPVTVSFIMSYVRVYLVSSAQAVAVQRYVSRTLALITSSQTVKAIKGVARTLVLSGAQAAQLMRTTLHIVVTTGSEVVSAIKNATHKIAAITSGAVASLIRGTSHVLPTISSAETLILRCATLKLVTLTLTPIQILINKTNYIIAWTSAQSVAFTKAYGHAYKVTSAEVVSLMRTEGKIILIPILQQVRQAKHFIDVFISNAQVITTFPRINIKHFALTSANVLIFLKTVGKVHKFVIAQLILPYRPHVKAIAINFVESVYIDPAKYLHIAITPMAQALTSICIGFNKGFVQTVFWPSEVIQTYFTLKYILTLLEPISVKIYPLQERRLNISQTQFVRIVRRISRLLSFSWVQTIFVYLRRPSKAVITSAESISVARLLARLVRPQWFQVVSVYKSFTLIWSRAFLIFQGQLVTRYRYATHVRLVALVQGQVANVQTSIKRIIQLVVSLITNSQLVQLFTQQVTHRKYEITWGNAQEITLIRAATVTLYDLITFTQAQVASLTTIRQHTIDTILSMPLSLVRATNKYVIAPFTSTITFWFEGFIRKLQPTLFAFGLVRKRTVYEVPNVSATNVLAPPIEPGVEFENVLFDYGLLLDPGVRILSANITVTTYDGVDTNPAAIAISYPIIAASQRTGAPAQAVVQQYGNTVDQTVYRLQCVAFLSDGQQKVLSALLPSAVSQ